MDQLPPLQQILGTDKKNPVFAIYRDAKEQILHVYSDLTKKGDFTLKQSQV